MDRANPAARHAEGSAEDDEERKLTATAQAEVASAHIDLLNICLVTLTTLAVLGALYEAAAIVLPLLAALVLNLLLSPVKRFLTDRLRFPAFLAALLLVLGLFTVLSAVGFALYAPASSWVAKVPQSLPELEQKMSFIKKPMDVLQSQVQQVQSAVRTAPKPGEQAPLVVQQQASATGVGMTVLSGMREVLGQLVTIVVTLFFMLTAGDTLLRSVVEILPSFGDKRRAVEIARAIESSISGYLLTITVMNLLVGIAAGCAMWALGVPNALLWGALAFLLNYIPIPWADDRGGDLLFRRAVQPPIGGLGRGAARDLPADPRARGRDGHADAVGPAVHVEPVLVIIALFFWDWLWGIPGAVLAVPVMATCKIICDHLPSLTPIGHLLGTSLKNSEKPDLVSSIAIK